MDSFQPPSDRDRENPYAPPQSTLLPQARDWSAAGVPFTVGDVFERSWSIFKTRFWTCLSVVWGVVGINWAISFGMNVLLTGLTEIARDETVYRLLYVLTLFGAIVLQIWVAWIGQTIALLKIVRGEPVAFEDVFKGGRMVLTTILASIVMLALIAVPILIAVGAITAGLVMMQNQSGLGAVLLFLVVSVPIGVVVVFLTVRLYMYYYMVIDRDAGVFESFRQSWQCTKYQASTITLVFCLELAILLAGFLALCVGLIFAIPLANLLVPVTYQFLTGTGKSGGTEPEFYWENEN
jgi:hypothetical protein